MWKRKNLTFKDFDTIKRGRKIFILLDVESEEKEKTLYIVKTMEEKIIVVYSFCEPIKEQNLLRTYGILKDTSVLRLILEGDTPM